MRKFLALTLALSSTMAFASNSGTLFLKGTVTARVSLAVTPTNEATTLDLLTSKTDLKVASVRERSNSGNGYKVSVSSVNGGKLRRGTTNDIVQYQMKYGGSQVPLNTNASTAFSTNTGAMVDASKDVTITYQAANPDNILSGEYSDTVTFVISAN